MPAALFALTLSAFAIGTTEFVIVGLLPLIAADLSVSVADAGWLVGLYALGVAFGAPVLTALTGRWRRKTALLALMGLFICGNLLAWQAPTFSFLIMARLLTGLAHGVFFSIGSTLAAGLVPLEQAARAIAMMFAGLTVALVTGVPLGTYIGQSYGWRATFLIVALLGLLAFFGSVLVVPGELKQTAQSSLTEQLAILKNPQLLLVYLITVFGYGAPFVTFTYLAPILEQISGFSSQAIGPILLAYGLSVVVGNLWGGRLADRLGPIRALTCLFAGLAVVLLLFTFSAGSRYAAVATLLVMGGFAFGNVPVLQVYVVRLARRYVPGAVDVASGLNISAFNIGIAFNAWIGGLIVERTELIHTSWIAAVMACVALLLTRISGRLMTRVTD